LSVPIYDLAIANEELAKMDTDDYFSCCAKRICKGCCHSLKESEDRTKCPFCNAERIGRTDEDNLVETRKRVDANDAGATHVLAGFYYFGVQGFQLDQTKGLELYARAVDLGCSEAHINLGMHYYKGGYMKKAKFHYEAAAMAGHEEARCNLGIIEAQTGNTEQALKSWTIAASSGHYKAMFQLKVCFEKGVVCRESIDSTLEAYNNSCAEMRSVDRDAYIRTIN
jgi:TPR repeat protein